MNDVPPIVHDVLGSPGQPLESTTRAFFESRFGHDFSRVRVHTDARAAQSARAVNALAYTVGRDIVFASGRYRPEATSDRLLAHELTHVVQQGRSPLPVSMQAGATISEDRPLEQEAERAADRIAAGNHMLVPSGRGATGLQRQPAPGSGAPQADDCSGYEQDPVSFSLKVARHVASTQINPSLARDGQMPDCVEPPEGQPHSTECHVPFKGGPTIDVLWNPRTRLTLAKFDDGGGMKRFLFSYSCPGGVLTLKFLSTHHTPTAPAPGAP